MHMKKLVIAAFAVVLVPTSLVFAQGTLNFSATSANHYFQLPDLTKAPAGTVGTLWWSPDNVVSFTQIAQNTTTSASGYLTTPTTGTTGPATAPGASAWFYVKGDVTVASIPYTGRTPNFNQATGGGGVPPSPPASLTGWTAPVTLQVVPEPSVIALAGLGLASLLVFRRRN
jgi:hypothetical protein